MTPQILDFMRRTKDELRVPVGSVLEVGSLDVNGTPRTVFQDESTEYVGIDLEPGPGVDIVGNAQYAIDNLIVTGKKFDTVVCCETLEHMVKPWSVVMDMWEILKVGGHLWVSTPTYGFPQHKYPVDCYRFGDDAYRLWLYEHQELLRIELLWDDLNQPGLAAVGKKLPSLMDLNR